METLTKLCDSPILNSIIFVKLLWILAVFWYLNDSAISVPLKKMRSSDWYHILWKKSVLDSRGVVWSRYTKFTTFVSGDTRQSGTKYSIDNQSFGYFEKPEKYRKGGKCSKLHARTAVRHTVSLILPTNLMPYLHGRVYLLPVFG